MLSKFPAWNVYLPLLLLQGQVFSLSRIWQANLIEAGDLFSVKSIFEQDTTNIPYPEGNWQFQYQGSLDWLGLMKKESSNPYEVSSRFFQNTFWYRPMPQLDMAVTEFHNSEKNRFLDSAQIEGTLGESRHSIGITLMLHLIPGQNYEPFLDLGFKIPSIDRQDLVWLFGGGKRGLWHAEYSLARNLESENFFVRNLSPSGGGEEVEGFYKTEVVSHRFSIQVPLLDGRVSSWVSYGNSLPDRPKSEFWFTDSSRKIEGNLSIMYPWFLGDWALSGSFRESEAITLGRRIPPGTDGLKRFHYAKNHAILWQLGAENIWQKYGITAGIFYRDYSWNSRPSENALTIRNETLSYNRLGLSFIANLYGGFFKESELISGDFSSGSWIAQTNWQKNFSTHWGFWETKIQISGFRSSFNLDVEGKTISQKFLSVDTSASYGPHTKGFFTGVTPQFQVKWGLGKFSVETGVAQIIPIQISTEGSKGNSSSPSEPHTNSKNPLFQNGFSCHLNLQAAY